ncbi:protein mono-ADP-ribosyltransferase PARP12-like [Salvelinus namaycush]|uniref:Poly [ADP-ribose] polymerase n=1 Tax=Salvelinus namaycush TaxID=8040 RepID=A0A8U0PZ60_SALNM|nr:protein mono-ADP-ribosyltransferase PARP12-like [Salvelinus namaycush]
METYIEDSLPAGILELRNPYHLVQIREGDEWKTVFNTASSHNKFLAMTFGLTNAPAMFQVLVNDVLCDMLNRFIPVPMPPFAKERAQLMLQHVFRIHGLRVDIVSYRVPQFSSRFWKVFCTLIGSLASLSSGTSNTNSSIVPPYWDQSRLPGIGFERVMLSSSTGEYEDIKAHFEKTVVGFHIHTIERVQNPALWKFYVLQRDQMKSSLTSINEKQLFHGTDSKYFDSICRDNFDWRICGKNGTSYGKGSYFARDAQYSHRFTSQSGLRSMFVCQVLVGDYTVGNSRYEKPPPKETGGSSFYDSCVDNIQDPRVFVVFETHQVYPEYLIQYCDGNSTAAHSPALLARNESLSHGAGGEGRAGLEERGQCES